jgi:hypothetical protein
MSATPVLLDLLPFELPPLGFFRASRRTGSGTRGSTSSGSATAAAFGCAAGAGEASARVAKMRVVAAVTFMFFL